MPGIFLNSFHELIHSILTIVIFYFADKKTEALLSEVTFPESLRSYMLF